MNLIGIVNDQGAKKEEGEENLRSEGSSPVPSATKATAADLLLRSTARKTTTFPHQESDVIQRLSNMKKRASTTSTTPLKKLRSCGLNTSAETAKWRKGTNPGTWSE